MQNVIIDKLSLYRGKECKITDSITIKVPTLGEICDYGEQNYYSMIHTLCSVGIDLCWQLEEMGIKFDEISDYELFITLLCKKYSNKQTKLLFGDILDFQKMIPYIDEKTNSVVLIQKYLDSIPVKLLPALNSNTISYIMNKNTVMVLENLENGYSKIQCNNVTGFIMSCYLSLYKNDTPYNCIISDPETPGNGIYKTVKLDENIYYKIVGYLRAMHNLKRDNRVAGTNSCRAAFIEDAKMEYEAAKYNPPKSMLLSMISTMVNMGGFKRNDSDIWDMNIYAFMDSVKRVIKIKNATLFLQSGYSGFGIDLKKVKKEMIDYMGELD